MIVQLRKQCHIEIFGCHKGGSNGQLMRFYLGICRVAKKNLVPIVHGSPLRKNGCVETPFYPKGGRHPFEGRLT